MVEPLKNKKTTMDFKIYEHIYKESDIKSAVEWLKKEIEDIRNNCLEDYSSEEYFLTGTVLSIIEKKIDLAFEDITKKE